jgi:excisionase family DNA binding protein
MNVMSVDEAAQRLHVSASRVRAQILGGDLPAQRLGSRWILDPSDVAALAASKDPQPVGGRMLSPRMAWGLIALADGLEPLRLSSAERSRLRARLRSHPKLSELARLARKRASVRRLRVHPGVLPRVLLIPGVVPAGVSAEGHDLVQPGMVEIYVPDKQFDKLVRDCAAKPASRSEANVIVRVPNVDFWPLGDHASRLAIAFDLWDAADARSRRAAERIYRAVLRSERFELR